MKIFTIIISRAQWDLYGNAFRECAKRGECILLWTRTKVPTVSFQNYEGVKSAIEYLAETALYVGDQRSWKAIRRKIDDGLARAMVS